MGLKRQIYEIVRRTQEVIATNNATIKVLEKQLAVKDARIKDLMNRVMAVDYRKFALYSAAADAGQLPDLKDIPFDADLDLAGEAVEVPDSATDVGRDN